jgi:hypothetical protein
LDIGIHQPPSKSELHRKLESSAANGASRELGPNRLRRCKLTIASHFAARRFPV